MDQATLDAIKAALADAKEHDDDRLLRIDCEDWLTVLVAEVERLQEVVDDQAVDVARLLDGVALITNDANSEVATHYGIEFRWHVARTCERLMAGEIVP